MSKKEEERWKRNGLSSRSAGSRPDTIGGKIPETDDGEVDILEHMADYFAAGMAK